MAARARPALTLNSDRDALGDRRRHPVRGYAQVGAHFAATALQLERLSSVGGNCGDRGRVNLPLLAAAQVAH